MSDRSWARGDRRIVFVDQTVTGPRGNCYSACLASLLCIGCDEVPNFYEVNEKTGRWMEACHEWLLERGLMWVMVADPYENDLTRPYIEELVFIASGQSPRAADRRHAVLWWDGRMIHDPHPSRAGLASEPDEFEMILSIGVNR